MPKSPKFYRQTSLWGCLLISLLLHLVGVYLVRDFWMEEIAPRAFRARLARIAPRFKPRRLVVGKKEIAAPRVEMEYLRSKAEPQEVPEGDMSRWAVVPKVEEQVAPTALREIASGAKGEIPELERVEMIRPSELGLADSMKVASMDLLRIVDMARGNREHALVMVDQKSRRDLLGYINFTRLSLYGAGSKRGGIDALTRYLRDYTRLLARVSEEAFELFLSEQLLKDPIHFLFEGGGLPPYRDEVVTYFSKEEKALLGRYLRGGGFLFVEGSNRFLREMAGHMRSALGEDGQLVTIPPSHMIYHSFYDFGGGFPGEDKSGRVEEKVEWGWYYPVHNVRPEDSANELATSQFANEDQEEEERTRPLGLWGVEFKGDLVAVFSDLGLNQNWIGSLDAESEDGSLYALMAGTNVVVYALTRAGGLTPKEERPVWMVKRPDVKQAEVERPSGEEGDGDGAEFVAAELLADLDASLAIVQAPLGSEIERNGLALRLDGRYSLELLKPGLHGLLLHNLPAGEHWLEVQYGGKRKQLEMDLQGGKVLTVTFGLNRFVFLSQLHMNQQEIQVGVEQWLDDFSDLQIEEIYLGEDRQLLEGADPF
jgi:hypothetical protein